MYSYYVSAKTARLWESVHGTGFDMVMIRGDEVLVNAVPDFASEERIAAVFRGRQGFVKQNQLMQERDLEMYFIDVGQGDSTFIVTPGNKKILIDGGIDNRALGFLAWLYRLDKPGNAVDIDLLVLSHADDDHLVGLTEVIKHPAIRVKRIVHSGIAVFDKGARPTELGARDASGGFLLSRHDTTVDLDPDASDLSGSFRAWRDAIVAKGCAYGAVSAGSTINVGDPNVTIDVLGPCLAQVPGDGLGYPWFDDARGDEKSLTINGHSVVLRLTYREVNLLLPGDTNPKGIGHLMPAPAAGTQFSAHVLKAPHHGSHEFVPAFLAAVRPQISVISSGDEPDHGHPRANFLAAVGRASRSDTPLMFATEIAATFVEAGSELNPGDPGDLAELDFASSEFNAVARKLFKQRLPGLINVRTDGHDLYAARRVNAGYKWESYGPFAAVP